MASWAVMKYPVQMEPPDSSAGQRIAGDSAQRTLAAKAGRGDRAAQAELLRDLQDVLYRFCFAILGQADAAQDATQETALRLLQRIGSFRGDSSVRTWALGIALNVCREARRVRSTPPLPEHHDAAGTNGSPEASAATNEEHSRLRALIRTLPERQREALVLRFFEGLSVEEAAQAMDCAAGTVKATVAQALRALRQQWKDRP